MNRNYYKIDGQIQPIERFINQGVPEIDEGLDTPGEVCDLLAHMLYYAMIAGKQCKKLFPWNYGKALEILNYNYFEKFYYEKACYEWHIPLIRKMEATFREPVTDTVKRVADTHRCYKGVYKIKDDHYEKFEWQIKKVHRIDIRHDEIESYSISMHDGNLEIVDAVPDGALTSDLIRHYTKAYTISSFHSPMKHWFTPGMTTKVET